LIKYLKKKKEEFKEKDKECQILRRENEMRILEENKPLP